MDYVFSAPPQASLPVVNNHARFPVRRIFCVGRNYAEHAREMGKDPTREPPFFFTKPADAIVAAGEDIPYPPQTQNLHYEAELVVAIGEGGENISQNEALSHVWGYAIGNDLTRRDLQAEAKEMGRPWDWGKGFDNSVVVGMVHSVKQVGHLEKGYIRLSLNGDPRQDGDLSQMIWNIPEIIAYISNSMTLQAGDLILTGTPAGVGDMQRGDICEISIEGLGSIQNKIV